MKWIILIVVLFIILVLYGGYSAQEDAKKKAVLLDSLRKKVSDIFSFTPTKQFEGEQSTYILAIDDSSEKILYVTEKEENLIDYSSVLSVELIEDEMTIQKKSSTRTIGGALVGGVLSGGVGAVIGGLSGSSTEKTKVSQLAVKILLKDIKNPYVIIQCLESIASMDSKGMFDKSSAYYKSRFKYASEIKDLLSIIIDRVDSREKTQQSDIKRNDTYRNISDELEKLYNLKEKGIITTEEFNSQKRKLLSE